VPSLLVLVSGPPAAGKTSLAVPLAERLGLPMLGKDIIKEALSHSIDVPDVEMSRRLGKATYDVLFAILAFVPMAVVESNFSPMARDPIRDLCPNVVEVFCRVPPEVATHRYATRRRHHVHFDQVRLPEIEAYAKAAEPLALGPVLEVDTTVPVDLDMIVHWVRRASGGQLDDTK